MNQVATQLTEQQRAYYRAKIEGGMAFVLGDSPDHNPHKKGTPEFNGWSDGWTVHTKRMEQST